MRSVLSLFVLSISLFPSVVLSNIDVLDISPRPNYPYVQEQGSFNRLIDGEVGGGKLWENKETLGWNAVAPIVLTLKIGEGVKGKVGDLYLHTQSDSGRGLGFFQRIDVYGKNKNSTGYIFLGGEFYAKPKNNKHYWVNVSLGSLFEEIVIVLHAVGKVVVLDELRVEAGESVNFADNEIVSKPLNDSFAKLISDKTAGSSSSSLKGQGMTETTTMVDYLSGQTISSIKNNFATNVELSENQLNYLYLAYKNNFSAAKTVCIDTDIPVDIFELTTVNTITGQTIFDPLLSLGHCTTIEPRGKIQIIIKVDARNFEGNSKQKFIKIFDKKDVDIKFIISKKNDLKAVDCSFVVNPWGYSTDLPIWADVKSTIDYLSSVGVNTFWVAPSKLPPVGRENGTLISKKDINKLEHEVSLFSGQGELILVMALDKFIGSTNNLYGKSEYLHHWLDLVVRIMEGSGFTYEKWALSLVDEARGENLKFMYEASRLIKKYNKKIRLYANPIVARHPTDDYATLKKLKPLIDVWQPRRSFLEAVPTSVYKHKNAKLWMYDNPAYPAKEAGIGFYKNLPSVAVKLGAQGVAFWALSDTRGSSAWSDIDGVRPDWSVLYEAEGHPVSSLRWEAFLQGVREACASI